MTRIGVIGAMAEEVQLIKESIQQRENYNLAGCDFSFGMIGGAEVVLLQAGIGKVNAAIGTTLLLQNHEPDFVINTGSAGGFQDFLNVGDIVISSEIRYHDVDATIFGYEYGQVPRMPAFYQPDGKLVRIAEVSGQQLTNVQIVKGMIASGDSFMNDPQRVSFIRSKFPELYAAEMEAAAVAQVCHQFYAPFVIIRSLSDIAGKDARMSYDQFLMTASENSARVVLHMIKELSSDDEKNERGKLQPGSHESESPLRTAGWSR